MSSFLPTVKTAPTRLNPKILILYGVPKVGKTSVLNELEDCLNLDAEGGAEMYTSLRLPVRSIEGPVVFKRKPDDTIDTDEHGQPIVSSVGLNTVYKEVITRAEAEAKALKEKGLPPIVKKPYKRIAFDTIDKIEDYCEVSATRKYKESIIGKNFGGNSVLELPQGAGYYHLRNEVLEKVDMFASICDTLILISHVKDKILDKGGVAVTATDLSLTGRLGSIVAAKADCIGYLYRNPADKKLWISFETNDSTIMGARFPRLAGQKFEFDWKRIFIDEPGK